MNPPVASAAPAGEVTLVSTLSEISESFSPELYALIAQQPFFKALNSQQLKLLATSALEMKFETGATIFEEGSPANRFFLFLTGRVQLSSEMGVRVAIFGSAWVIYAFPSCIFKAGACRT